MQTYFGLIMVFNLNRGTKENTMQIILNLNFKELNKVNVTSS